MKIEANSDQYDYLAMLLQTQQTQNTSNTDGTKSSNSSSAASISLKEDSLEISSDAYDAYSSNLKGSVSSKYTKTLDSLVDNGTITSDQEDTITSAMDSDSVDTSDGSNPLKATLDNLVSDGTITSDQADTIANSLTPPDQSGESLGASNITNSGAASGSATGVNGTMAPPPPPPPASSGSSDDDDGDDDISSYLDQILQKLVDNNTISSDQQDAIESALSSTVDDDSDGSNPLGTTLNSLISSGTITNNQASSIAYALTPPVAE